MITADLTIGTLTLADLRTVVEQHPRFWGGRDLRALHADVLVQEFGDTCFAVRRGGEVVGYLIGFVTPHRRGYVHLIAVRDDARKLGVAHSLWKAFTERAAALGATELKAITSVANTGSVAFHTAIGFEATRVEDYSGPGEARMVFRKEI
jgi:ribosomal protein S18 acetylase RimI-like enzyme